MRKVVILTLVTLFTCVEYSQAQTTEKEMTRQEKSGSGSFGQNVISGSQRGNRLTKPLYWKRTEFTLNTEPRLSFHQHQLWGLDI